ncbi:MAG TPA: DUF29 domain-containing protein [Terriglobales bacterium]|nr:DUF29 domain-containing protein [Terriglobales bacterium]
MKPRRTNLAIKSDEPDSLYDRDFAAWSSRTAALLRHRRFDEVDFDHLAEEVEDLGKRDLKELHSRVQVLLAHLLKWRYQRARRSRSWRSTIVAQRLEIEALLAQSSSLRPKIATGLARNYAGAVRRAAADTGLPAEHFPEACPFKTQQILNHDFLPDA